MPNGPVPGMGPDPDPTSEEETRGRHCPRNDMDPSTYSPSYQYNASPVLPPFQNHNTEIKLLQKQVELLERMLSLNHNNNTANNCQRLNEIYLPEYDPDDHKLTIKEWCSQVDSLINIRGVPPPVSMMKALSCLRGRAKYWADANAHLYGQWNEIRDQLITQFGGETRHIHFINKFREYTSNDAKSFAEFVTEAWRLFSKISPNATTSLLVEAVISGIRPKYYHAELLRCVPTSQAELISTLNNYRKVQPNDFRKRPAESTPANEPQRKNPRMEPAIICNHCGRQGHRSRDCKTKYCEYCKRPGHDTANCWTKPRSTNNTSPAVNNTPLVNVVQREPPCTTSATIGNIKLSCLIDTGAECSLIRESIATSVPGKRTLNNLQLKGVGGQSITSSQTISTIVALDEISIDVDLHVISDMSYDIILGVDVLRIPGVKISITNDSISVRREYFVHQIEKMCPLDVIDTDLTDSTPLTSILKKYNEYFDANAPLKLVQTGNLTIRLKDPQRVVQRRPYRLAPIEREKVKNIISDLKSKGIVRESCSPFASPILLVKKKNGDDRLCVDFRELNSNTIRDHFPLPLIQDQIDKLGKAKYFTTLDMKSGFHQIPIDNTSIEKTAFVTPDGQYEYVTMPFGLCNAPSVYQRAINKALGDYKDTLALVYIDDVIIPSETVEQGLHHLDLVLQKLTEAGFCFNKSKCKFLKTTIEYLGNVIENGNVKPSPYKISALKNSKPPTSVKQVRQFNGLAGYFRRFIPNFSQLMVPLYKLTKKDSKWQWTTDHEKIRQQIITYLTSDPILSIFDPNLPTEIHTDASSLGFGAILIQIENGRRRVISYFSMRTNEAESKYHSYELETLAVVKALKHFRHFLFGREFTVVTDCNALKASRTKKELTPRVHRWWAFLQTFEFNIQYRKGEQMSHVDFLSRNPEINIITKDPSWIIVEQERDPELKQIRDGIIKKENLDKKYSLKNNLLLITFQNQNGQSVTRTIAPKSLIRNLINNYHESLMHAGWERTLAKIRDQYWFKNMSKRVRSFCSNCVNCKVGKSASGKKQINLHPIPKVTVPFHTIHVDLMGNLTGCDKRSYAFVAIDAFTKFIIIYPLKDKTTGLILKALQDIINLFGTPSRIISDREPAIMGKEIQNLFNSSGIEHHAIARGVPRGNGQVERLMRTIRDHLTVMVQTQKKAWINKLGNLQLSINCTKSKATGYSPLELLIGKQCSPPTLEQISIIDNSVDRDDIRQKACVRMTEQAVKSKENFDSKHCTVVPFKENDFVLCRDTQWSKNKLGSKFLGPFQIIKKLDHDRYELKNLKTYRTIIAVHEDLRIVPNPNLNESDDGDDDRDSDVEASSSLTDAA